MRRSPCRLPLLAALAILAAMLIACGGGGSSAPKTIVTLDPSLKNEGTPTPRPTTTAIATATASPLPASRITWQGAAVYLFGANIPWFNWGCDFGCGANGGASSAQVGGEVGAALKRLHDAGGNVARWWVFPGEPKQFQLDASGAPAALDSAVYADFDAALALADANDVYYVFTLFSAPSHLPKTWLADPAQRAKLVAALGPLFARYANNPRIISWEVVNEPEWDIKDNAVKLADVQALVKDVATSVHANSKAYVTVGSAYLSGLPLWRNLGLDYYSAHWYDPMGSDDCARCTTFADVARKLGLDKPLTIGEFYAGTSTDAAARFEDLYAKGYAGAWAWALFPDRTADKLDIDLNAVRAFTSRHNDIGP